MLGDGCSMNRSGPRMALQGERYNAARAECVAGEQASEVDYFERITQVRSVGLQAHRTLFPLVKIGTHRSILREIRMDVVANEIEVINHYLPVLEGILLGG
jgi:hypothetical protein